MKRLLTWLRLSRSQDGTIRFYLDVHYHMMRSPQFWYDENLRKADAILCKAASDLRRATAKPNAPRKG